MLIKLMIFSWKIPIPEFSPVLSRDIKHSLCQHTAFSTRILVPIERSCSRPVTLMVATGRRNHRLPITNCLIRWSSGLVYAPRNCWATQVNYDEPGNHVWHSWCNWFNLCCKLVPLGNVSICITYVSNVENYVNVLQVLNKLSGGVKRSILEVIIFIRTISFILKHETWTNCT